MKDIHLWAPWFRELARTVAEQGEDYLVEKAMAVKWAGENPPALVSGDSRWIDPFSFLYTLAQKSTKYQRPVVYPSVHELFGITEELPDPTRGDFYIFPIPSPNTPVLFHQKTPEHFGLLWRLFREAVRESAHLPAEDYQSVLRIGGVGPTKLSQGLLLANPYVFLATDVFSVFSETEIHLTLPETHTYSEYLSACRSVRSYFPGCLPFEINHILYLVKRRRLDLKEASFFQISTSVHGPNDEDRWGTFRDERAVFTGGKASSVPWEQEDWDTQEHRPYPLQKPRRGDVVLVRFRPRTGRGIGVVIENDYARDGGLNGDSRIHVLWINKAPATLAIQTRRAPAMSGAPSADRGLLRGFSKAEEYRTTFTVLRALGAPTPPPPRPECNLRTKAEGQATYPRNQILYGPPGTGKTWSTMTMAVAVVGGWEVKTVDAVGRGQVKARFDELQSAGQIEMVTFHQNYAYEDFIEGIRPVIGADAEAEVGYELRPGVFRRIALAAAKNSRESEGMDKSTWDENEVLQGFLKWVDERTADQGPIPLFRRGKVDLSIAGTYFGRGGEIGGVRIQGTTEQNLYWRVLARDYRAFRREEIRSHLDIRPARRSESATHGQAIYFFEVLKKMAEYHDQHWNAFERERTDRRRFVLIIDEINRGNIARIFGELITLVEESRRVGESDETKLTLPYSGDEFGVPENLYIIGTMNTADRSIALLDTALRRRFEFVEMMPKTDHEGVSRNVDGVDCQRLLEAMNKRIWFLRDREHQIGHTYLLGVEDIRELKEAFQNRILPLLQEYFYDDWAKIDAVLAGNGFVKTVKCPEELKGKDLVDDDRDAYDVLPFSSPVWGLPEAYQKIYAGKAEKGAAPTYGEQPKGRAEARDE